MRVDYRLVKKFLSIDWISFQKSLESHAHVLELTPGLKAQNKTINRIIALCVAWKIKNGFEESKN